MSADELRPMRAGWYTDPTSPDALRYWNGVTWTDHAEPRSAIPADQIPEDESATAPAGWYTDPMGPAGLRFWDGLAWTSHTAPREAIPPDRRIVVQRPKQRYPTSTWWVKWLVGGVLVVAALIVVVGQVVSHRVVARQTADNNVSQTLLNAAMSFQSYYASNNHFPPSAGEAQGLSNPDAIVPPVGVTVDVTVDPYYGFCFAGSAPKSIYTPASPLVYDSSKGGLQAHGSKCSKTFPTRYTLTAP